MSKNKIYVPGKNDFLDWARKMNRNAELDLKKGAAVSGVNASVANSQTSREAGGKYDDQRT
ncbi:MAG: hypothetical protein E7649_06145 [Ruminococcaceae bacterium]|nr:hypothetical protein [Oscillospiraceae bacterium]